MLLFMLLLFFVKAIDAVAVKAFDVVSAKILDIVVVVRILNAAGFVKTLDVVSVKTLDVVVSITTLICFCQNS